MKLSEIIGLFTLQCIRTAHDCTAFLIAAVVVYILSFAFYWCKVGKKYNKTVGKVVTVLFPAVIVLWIVVLILAL